MEPVIEKEFTALGSLFQHIISDLKNGSPVWEDFLLKAGKFHAQLKSTLLASTSFLDAFQKIADMATNTKGATKEIGSALTRLCLRQRSVEAKLKIFSNALLEALVNPLQEKIEEWKRSVNNLDKEHTKEYKRAKQDLKKKSSDTLRLQKKVRKVGIIDIKRTLDYALQDVTDKYLLLEEIEKQSVRKALIEERSHFCFFAGYLQPVLESEMAMLHEISHIQEIIDTISKITGDPHLLPSASEQVIADVKNSGNTWSFQTPPGSPGSLGSRKSSVCSISSINSSSSGSLKSHPSRHLSHSQTLGRRHLNSVTSQDSGFTSQDTLCISNTSTNSDSSQLSTFLESGSTALSSPPSPVPKEASTWPEQESVTPEKESITSNRYQRPHTISSAYEKSSHSRPALTVHTFLPFEKEADFRDNYCSVGTFKSFQSKFKDRNCSSQPGTPISSRPSLPERIDDCSRSKPCLPEKSASVKAKHDNLHKTLPDFNRTPPDQIVPHPIYANSSELSSQNSQNIYSTKSEVLSESQSRKEFAAVLNEGLLLQSKWIRTEGTLSETEASSPVLRHCKPAAGTSETLPRSRGSISEEQMLDWQLSSLSSHYIMAHHGNQRRPMSIAGVGSSFVLPRKANTLQRMGSSNGPKPPTPVRRSSSITSSSVHSKSTEGISKIKPQSCNSGAGETRYSPNVRGYKSNSALPSPQERFSYSLRHVEKSKSTESASSCPSSIKDSSSSSENSIVTDVSDSRARLIHDLNFAVQQQRKPPPPQPPKKPTEAPAVPPRNASRERNSSVDSNADARYSVDNVLYTSVRNASDEQISKNKSKVEDKCSAENVLYGHCFRKERSSRTFNAKPVASHEMQRQYHQKQRLKECLSQSDLLHCSSDWDRAYQRRNGNDFSDSEITLKKSFVAALNAKLAEHQWQSQEEPVSDQQHLSGWHLKNDKNFRTWNSGFHRFQSQMCRESLMDQIKRGTRLRRVTCNDRSSPRIA